MTSHSSERKYLARGFIALLLAVCLGSLIYIIKEMSTEGNTTGDVKESKKDADANEGETILLQLALSAFVASVTSLGSWATFGFLRRLDEQRFVDRLNAEVQRLHEVLDSIARRDSFVHTDIQEVPWPNLFANSKEVYVIVHGWDKFLLLKNVTDALVEFANADGVFHILMPKTDGANAVRNLTLIAERVGKETATDQKKEIESTKAELAKFFQEHGKKKKNQTEQLKLYEAEEMSWFFAMYFITSKGLPNRLLISTYQHKRGEVAVKDTIAPSFVVPRHVISNFEEWFKIEWQRLGGGSPWQE